MRALEEHMARTFPTTNVRPVFEAASLVRNETIQDVKELTILEWVRLFRHVGI